MPFERWDVDKGYDPRLPGLSGKSPAGPVSYVRFGAFVDNIFSFDAAAFRLSRSEAEAMDPQHRLLLTLAAEVLTSMDGHRTNRQQTGLYVGSMYHEYAAVAGKIGTGVSPHLVTGGGPSFLAGRTSFSHGLGGPCVSLDTACSSSLVALSLAGDSLASGTTATAALVAGVNAMLDSATTSAICQLSALSPVGRCQSLDASADGYGRGEGFAVVGLARMWSGSDKQPPEAVLAGWAINQAGARAALSAPTGPAQSQVVRLALQRGRFDPSHMRAISLHGTGTTLGDPLEIAALSGALSSSSSSGRGAKRANQLALLSSKSLHAHTEGVAGLTGMLCALGTLHQHAIPQILHLRSVNPHLGAGLQDWQAHQHTIEIARQASALPVAQQTFAIGTSSFGMGGVNAHALLAEASLDAERDRALQMIQVSRELH